MAAAAADEGYDDDVRLLTENGFAEYGDCEAAAAAACDA